MLAIKLQRIGKKHQPGYRLVVAEKRSKLKAPPAEDLGSWNPFTKKANLKSDRVFHWIKVGARPTATVHNLLVKEGILNAPKVKIKVKAKAAPAKESPAPEQGAGGAPAAEASAEGAAAA
jgi:small subunit ribosomal protein S16